jgi:hypothetical protein
VDYDTILSTATHPNKAKTIWDILGLQIIWESVSYKLQADEGCIALAIFVDLACLKEIPEENRNKKVCSIALHGTYFMVTSSWESIPETLKKDSEFIIQNIAGASNFYNTLDDSIKNDSLVIMSMVRHCGTLLSKVDQRLQTKELAMAAVINVGCSLELVKNDLQSDREITLEAVSRISYTISYGRLQRHVNALKYATVDFQDDDEIVNAAIKVEPLAIEFASQRFRANESLIVELIKRDSSVIRALPEFSKDPEILKIVLRDDCQLYTESMREFVDKDLLSEIIMKYQNIVETMEF